MKFVRIVQIDQNSIGELSSNFYSGSSFASPKRLDIVYCRFDIESHLVVILNSACSLSYT